VVLTRNVENILQQPLLQIFKSAMLFVSSQKIVPSSPWMEANATSGLDLVQVSRIRVDLTSIRAHGRLNLISGQINVLILRSIVLIVTMCSTVDTRTKKTVLTTP
jgi:hypothetical protein